MHIASKADVKQSIENPLGEVVYELVGAPAWTPDDSVFV
jgi:hypothetical protein